MTNPRIAAIQAANRKFWADKSARGPVAPSVAARDAGNFNESDHPRGEGGQFGSGVGGSGQGVGSAEAMTKAKANLEMAKHQYEAFRGRKGEAPRKAFANYNAAIEAVKKLGG